MPLVTLSIRRGRDAREKKQLLDAVHDCLVQAFRIPEGDRLQRVREYASEDFELPEGKGERFVLVEITAFPGRSLEAKRKLYALLADRLEALGVPRKDVMVVLYEPPLESWGVRGGHPASEVDLGFALKV